MESTPGISVFRLLGIDTAELPKYSVRLNGSLGDRNIAFEYFSNRDRLLEHAHTVRWAGQMGRWIHTPHVLQFIQLTPRNKSEWLFIGSSRLTGSQHLNDAGDLVEDFTLDEDHNAFAGRLVVRYTRQGEQGPAALTYNLSKPHILEKLENWMIVDRVAQSPLSALPFPGFEKTRLNHSELVAALDNAEWRGALGSVSAIYLITDQSNGWHYVGSAYSRLGHDYGLLSRWSEYARGEFTGDNKKLRELVQREGSTYIEKNFVYSILEIFDRRASHSEIIRREHWWMDTLCSVWREDSPFGYNSVRGRISDGEDPDLE